MTLTERATYNAGIKAAINAAQIVATTIETAHDANTFRKKIAAEAFGCFRGKCQGIDARRANRSQRIYEREQYQFVVLKNIV